MCHTQCCMAVKQILNVCSRWMAHLLIGSTTYWEVRLRSAESGLNSNTRGGVEVLVCGGEGRAES